MKLKECAMKYYFDQNYNCAETIIHAANEYYSLGLHDYDMKLVGCYGAGIQTGNTCGAFLSAAAVLSMKYIEAKAHESADIRAAAMLLTRRFNEKLTSTVCREIKPVFFNRETRCQKTVETACDVLEEVIAEYDAQLAAKE